MRLTHLAPALLIAASASAQTYTYTANFDQSGFSDGSRLPTAPYAGQATLSFTAPSPLANGNYAWNSFSNLAFDVTLLLLNSTVISYSESDLDTNVTPTSEIHITLSNGSFFFTNSATNGRTTSLGNGRSPVDSPYIASAVFENGDYGFGSEFINSTLLTGGWSGGANKQYNAKYEMGGGPSGQRISIYGDYGTSTPVPEPSTYGLILGGLALAGAAVRRRKISK
jgi:hypothetical protein